MDLFHFSYTTRTPPTFGSNFRGDDSSHNMITLSEIVSYIQSLTPAQRYLVSEVNTLVKIDFSDASHHGNK